MPWNAPLDYPEQFAKQLAEYLRRRGDRTQSEIDRTYETSRDFAQFLGKEIHDASSKDYTTFKRRRVLTVQDEDAYQQMLDDIKAFCQTTPKRSFAPAQSENKERRKISTSRLQPSEEIMAFLLSPESNSPKDDNATPFKQATDPNSTRVQFERKRRGSIQFPLNSDASSDNEITSLPSQSNDLHVQDLFEDAKLQRPRDEQLATRAYSINLDDDPNLRLPQSANIANIPAHFLGKTNAHDDEIDDDNFSAFFSPSLDDNDAKFDPKGNFGNVDSDEANPSLPERRGLSNRSALQNDDDIARHVAQNDMSEAFLADGASPANNELLRGVSGVDYDFNQANLEIIRRGELNKVKHTQNNGLSPIDESLVYSNFRPYTVDDKYLVDIPNPDPNLYQVYSHSSRLPLQIPIIPILVAVALITFGFAISAVVGAITLGIAAAAAAVNRTTLLPPTHHTPVSAANAFFQAQATRAYTIALNLFAVPKDAQDPDIDLPTLWQNVAPPWKQTLINRIRPKREIETRIVAGSDVQNSVVVLCTKGDDYWLLPLVRIQNAWYATSTELPVHTVHTNGSGAQAF